NDERGASQVFDALDRYYAEWSWEEWSEDDRSEATQMLILDECDRYLAYVVACDAENLDALPFDMWQVHDMPAGPI
ncbi:hypothetical protein M3M33_16410, partial [Loigolactobacillus coryniformis]|uniref:hypothetical protein n=1 Tax=Loigolactobacillus coryniformis TaxID=1610 RepID=UPI00201A4406